MRIQRPALELQMDTAMLDQKETSWHRKRTAASRSAPAGLGALVEDRHEHVERGVPVHVRAVRVRLRVHEQPHLGSANQLLS